MNTIYMCKLSTDEVLATVTIICEDKTPAESLHFYNHCISTCAFCWLQNFKMSQGLILCPRVPQLDATFLQSSIDVPCNVTGTKSPITPDKYYACYHWKDYRVFSMIVYYSTYSDHYMHYNYAAFMPNM